LGWRNPLGRSLPSCGIQTIIYGWLRFGDSHFRVEELSLSQTSSCAEAKVDPNKWNLTS